MRLASVLLLIILALTGCSYVSEVEQRIMVYALGVDREEDGNFSVSYQAFDPSGDKGSSPVGADEKNIKIIEAKGKSLFECEKQVELMTGKEIFVGDTELIVLGDSIKNEDIEKLMSYFRNSKDIYLGTDMIFSSGKAIEVIDVGKSKKGVDPQSLGLMLSAAVSSSRAYSSRVIEVTNEMSGSNSMVIPIMTLEKDEEGQPYPKGVMTNMLLVDGRGVDTLNEDEAKGARLLRGNAKILSLNIPEGEYESAAVVKIKKTKRSVEIGQNGYPVVTVRIEGEISITENPSDTDREVLRLSAQKELVKYCDLAYQKAMKNSADIFEIGLMLQKYQPRYYDEMRQNFENMLENTEFQVFITLQTR